MKPEFLTRNKSLIASLIVTTAIMQGCAVYSTYNSEPLSVKDVVGMSKEGKSSKEIIREIRHTHTVYSLKADQLAKLRDEGVQDSVINYMEKTHLDAVRHEQRMSDYYWDWPGYGYYGAFGWPYGYWGWGPAIFYSHPRFYSSHGGYHGHYKH